MIELQHFSIGYKENSLLHEVNATIKKGQLTALIGTGVIPEKSFSTGTTSPA